METEERIGYSVAFKAVVDYVCAEEVVFETDDIVLETIELTDAFYDAIATKTGMALLADTGKAPKKSSSRSRSTSVKRDSNRSGNTKKQSSGPKDPNADASPAQINFLKKLLSEDGYNVGNEDGFELNGEEYFFDEFTMGSIQVPIEALKK